MNAHAALKEFLGGRADGQSSKTALYNDISMNGFVYLKDLPKEISQSQTLNTVAVYLLGAGIKNDLLDETDDIEEYLKNQIAKEKRKSIPKVSKISNTDIIR